MEKDLLNMKYMEMEWNYSREKHLTEDQIK